MEPDCEDTQVEPGFLLYANDTMFHWLPMTAFASDEDRKRADELLRCKVKDFADVK